MNKISLMILELEMKFPNITQRKVANRLNISLGKCNRVLNELRNENFLTTHLDVSKEGIDYIKHHHPKRAIILAAGFGMRMVPINTEQPKGLLEVKGVPLIERLIKQLKEKGINDIHVVVGFMKEHYEYLIDKYDVKFIVNKYYGYYNNIYSLYLASDLLDQCYIIPCDLWFKENPFSEVEDRSWYLFSDERVLESTWEVTNQERIKNVPSYGNKMVGVSYIDKETGQKLQQKLHKVIKKEHMVHQFWETILELNKHFIIKPFTIKKSDYYEINSYEELRDIDSQSSHLRNSAIKAICKALKVSSDEIHDIKVLKKGMTNRSFLFQCQERKFIMRIPGKGTDKLISRKDEYEVYQKINKLPYVEKTLYLNPNNGYKLTEYINGSHNCDPHNSNEVKRAMELLHKFHDQSIKVENAFNLREQIQLYEKLRQSPSAFRDYDVIRNRINTLLDYVESLDKDWTLCHIDANADNFIFDSNDNLFLIDWEYAGMQDPHIDIAMFAIYSMYSRKEIEDLIKYYFGGEVTTKLKIKIFAYIAICGFLWSNWCEYKQSLGMDFGEYSLSQYRYAKEYSKLVQNMLGENNDIN